jgi:xanthine dehydrogenase accessory factor
MLNLSETADVLEAMGAAAERGERMALATIVSVRGSTYRRPGARFLVPESGEPVGNLSGGCLEGEVETVSRTVMRDGETRLELYDLTADDEVVWGWGLGCNGAIEVFVEPADKALEIADALRTAIRDERRVAVGTVLESTMPGLERGDRMLRSDGDQEGSLGDESARGALGRAVAAALVGGETGIVELSSEGGRARVFIEAIEPPLRLLVCGAGHDAIPLVHQASRLGWTVVVTDDRESFLNEERFPGASSFVLARPDEVADRVGADSRSYAVVMSHNYLRDRAYLRALLGTDAAYIGMLGPKARLARLFDDLAGDGVRPSLEERARVHGPAGLDLGAEGPDEIAAAIVAEILALARGRFAGFLRDRETTIHGDRGAVATA